MWNLCGLFPVRTSLIPHPQALPHMVPISQGRTKLRLTHEPFRASAGGELGRGDHTGYSQWDLGDGSSPEGMEEARRRVEAAVAVLVR